MEQVRIEDFHKGFEPTGYAVLCYEPITTESTIIGVEKEAVYREVIRQGLEVVVASSAADVAGFKVGDKLLIGPNMEPIVMPFTVNDRTVVLVNCNTVIGKFV